MGKTRNKKKADPLKSVRIQNSKQPVEEDIARECSDDEELREPRGETCLPVVQQIIEQLNSTSSEDRDRALNHIASLCDRPSYLKEIVREDLGILKRIAQLLTDNTAMIRHSAAGALRNLSLSGSEVCHQLVQEGALVHLLALLEMKYQEGVKFTPEKKKSEGSSSVNTLEDTFIQCVSLLCNLCSCSDSENDNILSAFNKASVALILGKYLDLKSYQCKVILPVVQCLYTATEDNEDGIEDCKHFKASLESLAFETVGECSSTPEYIQIRTLCIGILLNIENWNLSNFSSSYINTIVDVLNTALGLDHLKLCNSLSSEIPIPSADHQKNTTNDLQADYRAVESFEKVQEIINCETQALEILSNLLFTESEGNISDDSDEDMESENNELVDQCEFGKNEHAHLSRAELELQERVLDLNMVAKVSSKLKNPAVNVVQILKEDSRFGQSILKKLSHLTVTALICLQNMLDCLEASRLNESLSIKDIWDSAEGILQQSDIDEREDLREAVTSVLRAVVEKTVALVDDTKSNCCIFSPDFTIWKNLYDKEKTGKIRVNLIRIIGGLGTMMTKTHSKKSAVAVELETGITQSSEFLINSIFSTNSSQIKDVETLWIVSEALDSLMDMYTEDDVNHLMRQLDIVPKLKNFTPAFKKAVHGKRKLLGDNFSVVDTVKINLPRFIDYKIKQGCPA